MISVFFRCNCPFVGYLQRKVDYMNHMLTEGTKQEMTYTGYSLFRSSGSYMILANFEGRRYFHSRQSKTSSLDDQNRPVRNNVVFVGSTPEDDVVIGRLAGYALLKETEFYKEIASMITLLDGDFEVDYEKLKAFIKRFQKDYKVESPNAADLKMCQDIFFQRTTNDVDFIVLEADLDFLNKQLGRVAKVQYAFDYKKMQELSKRVTITFPTEQVQSDMSVQCEVVTIPEEGLEQEESSLKNNEGAKQPEAVLEAAKNAISDQTVTEEITTDSEQKQEENTLTFTKVTEQSDETRTIPQYEKKHQTIELRSFLFGVAAGIIGTLLVLPIIKIIF